MKLISLSWVVQVDFPATGGCIYDPAWDVVAEKLDLVLRTDGSVILDAEDDADRSRSLQVQVERGNFLLTLGVESENEWIVRGFENQNVSAPGEMIALRGGFWNSTKICNDPEIVTSVFREFFESGDVSNQYLS
jgi:hypothetical protein